MSHLLLPENKYDFCQIISIPNMFTFDELSHVSHIIIH